jgi:hypothetical protein
MGRSGLCVTSAVAGKNDSGVAVGSPDLLTSVHAERSNARSSMTIKQEVACFLIIGNPMYYKRFRTKL